MKGTGILLDDNYDLQIEVVRNSAGKIISGLKIGNVLYQNQALILTIQPGELKLSPLVGVGVAGILYTRNFLRWQSNIRAQFEQDGQTVTSINLTSQKLEANATYS